MDHAKVARTEAAFRELNEAIATTAQLLESNEARFVCECGDAACGHPVTASLEDYEEVRDDATHFLVAPGHAKPAIERVIRQRGDYHVVEKFGAAVVRIVRRLNPRAV